MDRVAQDRAPTEVARTPPVRRHIGALASVEDAAVDLGIRIGAPPVGRSGGTRIRRRADRIEPPHPAATPSRIRRGDALPEGLRAGVEQLSGVAMDDVRVHYDSAEPGRLQALAYAQGADIHVAPGEERHLPHEAWHVAQQAQGRVTPTRQLRGVSSVNDDQELEREASVMGDRAARLGRRALDAPVAGTLTAPAQDGPAQLVREDEFRASPPTFLATNVLSLTMLDGLKLRSADERLTPRYDALLSSLGRLPRHWFKLVVDTTRDKPTQHAYILTPALEKYVAAYPEDEAFAGLAGAVAAVLPVEDEAAYVSSAYVDYKNIGVEAGRHDETIGHTEIVRSADDDSGDFNPDIVFTAAMNGCAFAVTPSADDRKFVAWHFQSTTANRQEAARFREERGPTDWFGEDEYDDNQHAGLFEVTNMLHRGEDGSWNVVSQQNETAAMNRSDVTIKNVTSRPLSLDEPARAAIIKRIYAALQVNKNRDIRRYAENAAKYEPLLPRLAEKSALLAVKVKVFTLLEAEEAALVDGDTLPELLLNALAIRGRRDDNVDQLRAATAALAVHFEERYAAENRKWKINQDKAILASLPLAIANLHDIPKYYARFDWLTTMIAEMTPPAEEI